MTDGLFYSPVVAYASFDVRSNSVGDSDFEYLQRFCLKHPFPIELLAESASQDGKRIFWNQILDEIERGGVTTLIVPSLQHIAGDNELGLLRLLTFLKEHRVKLRSLKENVNSHKLSRRDILSRFQSSTKTNRPAVSHV
jgi:DNA invertase Pin-like site-specific DNA recombinase